MKSSVGNGVIFQIKNRSEDYHHRAVIGKMCFVAKPFIPWKYCSSATKVSTLNKEIIFIYTTNKTS